MLNPAVMKQQNTPCPRNSHFNFRHKFAICWNIFTLFEAFYSGIGLIYALIWGDSLLQPSV